MKRFQMNINLNAKLTLALAVCTLLALSASSRAVDSQLGKGAPPTGTTPADSAKTTSNLSRHDEKFIKDAAEGGMMEVHVGQLGVQKGQSAEVKQYAQRLIDDHTKANTELKQLAASKGVTLPDDKIASNTEADRSRVREILEGHKDIADYKKLENLSGTEFDREFVRMAVNDHEKDVKEFDKAAEKSDDADVKAFAQKTAPILREHLQQAKALQTPSSGTSGGKSGN